MVPPQLKQVTFELTDTRYVGPLHLVYNESMATLDENTIYLPNSNPGAANTMQIAESSGGKTTVQFIYYKKVTNDHVDEAEVVGSVSFGETDLKKFHVHLTKYIEKNYPKR